MSVIEFNLKQFFSEPANIENLITVKGITTEKTIETFSWMYYNLCQRCSKKLVDETIIQKGYAPLIAALKRTEQKAS